MKINSDEGLAQIIGLLKDWASGFNLEKVLLTDSLTFTQANMSRRFLGISDILPVFLRLAKLDF